MKYYLLAAAAAICISSASSAQTMALNTGYNYNGLTLYPLPSGPPSTVQDNYWIKIASFEPPATNPPIAPAWVLNGAWVGPWTTLPNSRWLGPQTTPTGGTAGTSATNPAYYIYRKCFCLMAGYQNPTLSFQLRTDNEGNAWLNSITNVLVPPSPSSFSGAAINSQPTSPAMFRTGLNCVYVLVQNTGGPTGFDLAGQVSAIGLMPIAGAGVNNSFAPCQCGDTHGPATPGSAASRGTAAEGDDSATIRAIVAFAEARRRQAAAPR